MTKALKTFLTKLSPVLGAGAIGVCPLCWVGSAGLLTYLGLGAFIPWWQGIAIAFLALAVVGFAFDYRSHRHWHPLALLVAGGVLLYLGRYVWGGDGFGGWPIWGTGALVILLAVFDNKRHFRLGGEKGVRNLFRGAPFGSCREKVPDTFFACPECGLKYRTAERAADCEAWCRAHKSCNLDIIKDAVEEKTT